MKQYCAAKMCPKCGANSVVYYSRQKLDGSIARKRKCPSCGVKYTTREVFEELVKNKGV